MRRLCRQLMRRTWKYTIRRASQFLGHLQRFGGLLWTLWSSLSTAQQLLVVTPVIVWYGYVYFIPAASRARAYIKTRAVKR
ncbi:hypothetical protein C8J57DRAFT_208959 [Mycena rebaudengoi]|nr:hypothetical protein C8J57DRAFT_208959 [Mycena rebaudengoi]